MASKGNYFTKLPRGYQSEPWWKGQSWETRAMAMAIHSAVRVKPRTIDECGFEVTVQRGQLIASLAQLMKLSELSKQQVRSCIKKLKDLGHIDVQPACPHHKSRKVYTLVNADRFIAKTQRATQFPTQSDSENQHKEQHKENRKSQHKEQHNRKNGKSSKNQGNPGGDESGATQRSTQPETSKPTQRSTQPDSENQHNNQHKDRHNAYSRANQNGSDETVVRERRTDVLDVSAREQTSVSPSGSTSDPLVSGHTETVDLPLDVLTESAEGVCLCWQSPPDKSDQPLPLIRDERLTQEQLIRKVIAWLQAALPPDVKAAIQRQGLYEPDFPLGSWLETWIPEVYQRPFFTEGNGTHPPMALEVFVTGEKGDPAYFFRRMMEGEYRPRHKPQSSRAKQQAVIQQQVLRKETPAPGWDERQLAEQGLTEDELIERAPALAGPGVVNLFRGSEP